MLRGKMESPKTITPLDKLDERLAEAEQAYRRAVDARKALASFEEAGVNRLHRVSQERQAWESKRYSGLTIRNSIQSTLSLFALSGEIPVVDDELLTEEGIEHHDLELGRRWNEIKESVQDVVDASESWSADVETIVKRLTKREADIRVEVERALAERGFDASQFKEFEALNRRASLLPSYKTALDEINSEWRSAEDDFTRLREKRREVTENQREAFDRIAATLENALGDKVQVKRMDEGDLGLIYNFLIGLRQRGITRWWNDLDAGQKPSAEKLVACLDGGSLEELGMSDSVQEPFRESLTKSKRRELMALRCPDLYRLKLQMEDGSFRALEELSGGQRVSLLLSLLLETADERPLVIDQPEDELDNRFLFDTVLPTLKKLRGRRQVIVATHNANIVVNGDAEMVIQLEASARHGRVGCAGAIEDPEVRAAIVRTVDGGEEAFRLRRQKYGF